VIKVVKENVKKEETEELKRNLRQPAQRWNWNRKLG